MLQKQRQVLILLVGLLYVYSVCPLLCAAFEQKFCNNPLQKVLRTDIGISAICCQTTQTGTAGESKNPLDGSKTCCATHLELVLSDDRYDTHKSREWIEQFRVSILPISVTLPVAAPESFEVPPIFFSTLFPDHRLTRRGPPSA